MRSLFIVNIASLRLEYLHEVCARIEATDKISELASIQNELVNKAHKECYSAKCKDDISFAITLANVRMQILSKYPLNQNSAA